MQRTFKLLVNRHFSEKVEILQKHSSYKQSFGKTLINYSGFGGA